MTTQAPPQCFHQPETAQCSNATVLVVDDDPEFRALALRILGTAGFDVDEVSNVSACLAHLRSHATDLVILDIVLPDKDGIEALTEIKALYPDTRIVTVSGADNSALYLKVSAYLGADASLQKSRIASLCALLKVVLEG